MLARESDRHALCSFTIAEFHGLGQHRPPRDRIVRVWIVDAKLRQGLIELRAVGGWFKVDRQLYVGGRRQTRLIDNMGWQIEAVQGVLGGDSVPVRPAVCFVDGEWKLFAKPFELRGVLVCWPKKLVERISEEGPLDAEDVLAVAGYLSNSLPAKGSSQSASHPK